ncbi:division/cell wall cluster transcriptional repressor MraZ [Clostridium luticellarii]|jgi:MraZ protein|uniref:Transcriptional regulator MraZ n=1 Tax=Clostridium luticellarii TaxID=1691940 RepID=A0A2T0BRT4_9CLOT|nr:division/cell wall cluster transcriptional repressor MraZ [Clostridium luticellarii]MCI1943704.1 division/cell wall cluster transcriptional repressor MraZ [Clostridium luticellarii]MCI1966965.1 division/cell wall cluster transcriptional repressor MraZ [Clostridium luticellarii]MCI1994332.1 division/cell wall cluster transcriptional repressor MraZ [Clostridium luticellarii]MCI2038715.1 division/cell wall cluster transcriptional repressor MraZ [Clostridium luticellarii]PRR86590.1 cell divisio
MFLGEYEHALDGKKRIIIPSKFREELGAKFILTKGLDGCLYAFPLNEWHVLEEKLKGLPFTNKNARAFVRFFFSGANEMEPDKQGRIVMPQPLLEYARINKDIVSIGVSSRVEIWSKEGWQKYNNSNIDFDSIAEQLSELGI